jgi:NADPH:quinone reductase-like Zn-dependent oxidoreductase
MPLPATHRAIWIDTSNQLSLRTISENYVPKEAQVLVEVKYSGINPADIKHGLHLGLNNYPSGYEYCGKVVGVGPTSTYQVGDIVAGHNLVGKHKPIYHGVHQDYVIGEHFLFRVPPSMPAQDAACISIMAQTAADALFSQLALPSTILGDAVPTQTPILIWGGSSNVGVAAIQLAKAAGVGPILVTASPKNHSLKELGADECFDYRDPDVVAQIKSAVTKRGKRLLHVLDAVGAATDFCEACCDEDAVLAATLPVPKRPRWKMVLATRNVDFPAPRPDGSIHWVRGNEEWQRRIDTAF